MPDLVFHHMGVPTDQPREGEEYVQEFKMFASGYFESPYGVEWLRFEPNCPLPELIKRVPHVAFVVKDLEKAIAGKDVLVQPNSPAEGVMVAFIEHNGAPIEFLQFDKPENEIWPHDAKFRLE